MWKPTKFGQYLLKGSVATVMLRDDRLIVWNATRDCQDVQPAQWSLLAPDRQKCAPTHAQLERWQWWAVWWSFGDMWLGTCRLYTNTYDPVELLDGIYVGAHSGSTDEILYSAPIQPDLSTGPLWVPLEVTNE